MVCNNVFTPVSLRFYVTPDRPRGRPGDPFAEERAAGSVSPAIEGRTIDLRRFTRSTLALALFPMALTAATEAVDVGLRGSPASMKRQHAIALDHDLVFNKTPKQIEEQVERGRLVPVEGNDEYWVKTKRSPYALPEVRKFIEWLSVRYRAATGEQLVVTSLTRAASHQPSNAHPLSVHPAGMAVDLRVPKNKASRQWLERTLLSLEEEGVLDVTREYRPPHYHVAVFPAAFGEYVAPMEAAEARAEALVRVVEREEAESARRAGAAAVSLASAAGLAVLGIRRRRRA